MFRRLVLPLALAFSLALPQVALAAQAEDFVKDKQAELNSLIKQNQDKKLEALVDEVFDYDALAQGSLGDDWAARTPEERAEFQKVLTQLVRAAYRKNLKKTADYDVTFKGEQPGNGGTLVLSEAKSRKNARQEVVTIDYLVHQVGGKWRIRDIVTEGSSMVSSYRSQFRPIIKKKGFPELLKRMKTKLDKGDVG